MRLEKEERLWWVLKWVFWSFNKNLTKIFNRVSDVGAKGDKNETIRGKLRF